jgi:hypothetical protein
MFEMTASVIDARSCVPFEPQKLEFSSCQNFIELPRCQLESHAQSVLNAVNGPIKKVTRVLHNMQASVILE